MILKIRSIDKKRKIFKIKTYYRLLGIKVLLKEFYKVVPNLKNQNKS
jgi:hypothetical protein